MICILFLLESFTNENELDSIRNEKAKNYIDNLVIKYNDQSLLLNDSILYVLNHIQTLSQEINYKKGLAESNYLIGNFYDLRSIGDSSIKYYMLGWELGKKINYNHYVNRFGEYIAETFWETGNYYEGLDFTKNLINHYNNLNYTDRLFYLYDVIALIYRDIGDFNAALNYFNKSYEHAVSIKQMGFAGTTLTNIGALYLQQEEYDTALKYYEKGVALEKEYGHIAYAGRSYVSIAKIQLHKGDFAKSELFLNKALSYNNKTNDKVGFSRTYKTYGELFLIKKDFKKALSYFLKAKDIAEQSGKNLALAEIYYDISLAYEHLKYFDYSVIYLKKYINIYKDKIDLKKLTDLKKVEYELKVEKNNIKLQQLEIEKHKTKNTLLTVIFALAILISSLFGIFYFQSIKSKKQLQKVNSKLEKASKKANESDQLKTLFLQNISHEIRTPLNGIVGFTSMLNEESLSIKEKDEISFYVNKNSEDLIATIDNIVDIAHLTSSQYEVFNKDVNISDFMNKFISEIKTKSFIIENKHIKFTHSKFCNIIIKTDKNVISKILTQLISNAFKFTKEGSVNIEIKVIDKYLRFSVSDTGIGISDDKIQEIFSTFRQGKDQWLTRGNGLGLAIVKHLIDLLDSKIHVKSNINNGTIFWFEIPIY